MKKLLQFGRTIEAQRDLLFDLIRIYIGIALLVRGMLFFLPTGQDILHGFLDDVAGGAWGIIALVSHYIILVHLAGGFFLAIGLLTRLSAALQLPILFGAVFFVHFQDGLFAAGQSLELSGLVLFLLIIIVLHGPGRLSMDHYLSLKPVSRTASPPEQPVDAGRSS